MERKLTLEAIKRAFDLIGSRVVVTDVAPLPVRTVMVINPPETRNPALPAPVITVDIIRDRRGELFHIGLDASVELHVMNVNKALRHLLLFAVDGEGRRYRYLCGHDERHWFAAAIAGGVSSVEDALESLKPGEVLDAQSGLRRKHRNKRNSGVTLRQGEWFFIPTPDLDPHPGSILRDEPIRRGNGSPHMVEDVFRQGGITVFVCGQYPAGVEEKELQRLIEEEEERRFWGWQSMKRDMDVFGRGKVSHRDHETITLNGWHRILANTEAEAWFRSETLVFLD
jgi:hypothetical protein